MPGRAVYRLAKLQPAVSPQIRPIGKVSCQERSPIAVRRQDKIRRGKKEELECGPMPNVVVALSNIGGTLCSTPQSLADADYTRVPCSNDAKDAKPVEICSDAPNYRTDLSRQWA